MKAGLQRHNDRPAAPRDIERNRAGGVVAVNKTANGSSPNSAPVLVAIPDVSPDSLVVKIDGLSLFPALGKMPSACTPASR